MAASASSAASARPAEAAPQVFTVREINISEREALEKTLRAWYQVSVEMEQAGDALMCDKQAKSKYTHEIGLVRAYMGQLTNHFEYMGHPELQERMDDRMIAVFGPEGELYSIASITIAKMNRLGPEGILKILGIISDPHHHRSELNPHQPKIRGPGSLLINRIKEIARQERVTVTTELNDEWSVDFFRKHMFSAELDKSYRGDGFKCRWVPDELKYNFIVK